jgi:hypothetical protein
MGVTEGILTLTAYPGGVNTTYDKKKKFESIIRDRRRMDGEWRVGREGTRETEPVALRTLIYAQIIIIPRTANTTKKTTIKNIKNIKKKKEKKKSALDSLDSNGQGGSERGGTHCPMYVSRASCAHV